MGDEADEVAKFGRELAEGGNPEIERGGTLAGDRDKHSDGHDHGARRRPPHGRSHAAL
jgi:hypothetical protein